MNYIKILEKQQYIRTKDTGMHIDTVEFFLDILFLASIGNLKEFKEKIKKIVPEDLKLIINAITIFAEEMEKNPFSDILGDFILEYKGKKEKQWKGQFFTPEHISYIMALSIINEKTIQDAINEERLLTVAEPSSGSGRMILQLAKVLKTYLPKKTNIANICFFRAIDIDITCVKMTAINTGLWNLPTQIIHGNGLADEIFKEYKNLSLKLALKNPSYVRKLKNNLKKEKNQKSPKNILQLSLNLQLD